MCMQAIAHIWLCCLKTVISRHTGSKCAVDYTIADLHFLSCIASINSCGVLELAHLSSFSIFQIFHTVLIFSLRCCTTCKSVPQSESSGLFGFFKHKASDSLRLWSVWDWTISVAELGEAWLALMTSHTGLIQLTQGCCIVSAAWGHQSRFCRAVCVLDLLIAAQM